MTVKLCLALILASSVFTPAAMALRTRAPRTIVVRNGESIQAAVNSVANGGKVVLTTGLFVVEQTIEIPVGKQITIVGGGSTCDDRMQCTEVRGPVPTRVTPAESSQGTFKVPVNSKVHFQSMLVTGSDASLRLPLSEAEKTNPDDEIPFVEIQDVQFSDGGRAILGQGSLIIKDSKIKNTLWHGLSLTGGQLVMIHSNIQSTHRAGVYINPSFFGASCSTADIHNSVIADNSGPGIYVLGCTDVKIKNNIINSNLKGGISIINSGAEITANVIVDNSLAGIYLKNSAASLIDNRIADTHEAQTEFGLVAFAVFAACGTNLVWDIKDGFALSALFPAGAYNSKAAIGVVGPGSIQFGNVISECNSATDFYFDEGTILGCPGSPNVDVLAGNVCGCPAGSQPCQFVGVPLVPNTPLDVP